MLAHLPQQILLFGPACETWEFSFESYAGRCKSEGVQNRAHPEASICSRQSLNLMMDLLQSLAQVRVLHVLAHLSCCGALQLEGLLACCAYAVTAANTNPHLPPPQPLIQRAAPAEPLVEVEVMGRSSTGRLSAEQRSELMGWMQANMEGYAQLHG